VADPELGQGGAKDFFFNFSSRERPNHFFTAFFLKIHSFFMKMTFFAFERGGYGPLPPLNPPLLGTIEKCSGYRYLYLWRIRVTEEIY